MSGISVDFHGDLPQPELSSHSQQHIESAVATAKTECLKFSTQMHIKLPKELRDMVYSYLCVEDRQVPIGPYYHFRQYEPAKSDKPSYTNTEYHPRSGDLHTELADGQVRTDHDIYPPDDLILPNSHIFNTEYMGHDIALELLKTYYEGNSFSVCNIEGGLDDLCTAVISNPDGAALDFVPIDHIHDLQIRIKCEHFTEIISHSGVDVGVRLKELVEKELFLRRTVESLRSFRSKIQATTHELNIEVVLMLGSNKKGSLNSMSTFKGVRNMNFLQAVRNMVYELIHDRKHTTVRVTGQDDSLWAFPRNYTGLFRMTKENWDLEKSRQQPKRDWSQDFWILPISGTPFPASDLLQLGGYYFDGLATSSSHDLTSFLLSRWGIQSMWRETISSESTSENGALAENEYWPVGRPFNPLFAQRLIDRAALGVKDGMEGEADAW